MVEPQAAHASDYVTAGRKHLRRRQPAPCKTVGSAYVGSNPTPATTVNSPWLPHAVRGYLVGQRGRHVASGLRQQRGCHRLTEETSVSGQIPSAADDEEFVEFGGAVGPHHIGGVLQRDAGFEVTAVG